MRQLPDIIINQGNICRLHGNIRTGSSHGNAHISLLQGGSIIDAIANHAHRHHLILIFPDIFQLAFRQALCLHLINMQLAGHMISSIGIVPSQQHRLHLLCL